MTYRNSRRSKRPALVAAMGLLLAAVPAAGLQGLVITEIQYHSQDLDDRPFEFIELYNENPDPMDLSGYSICNGVLLQFPPRTYIDGRSFLVVCSNLAAFQSRYGALSVPVIQWTSGALENGGERIEICNLAGKTIVEVRYNDSGKWAGGGDGTGHSLEIADPYRDPDDPDNWVLSNDPLGSPGLPNPCWTASAAPAPIDGGPVGIFTNHRDVGSPCSPGDTVFTSANGRYTISGSGDDIWQGGDQFQFAYVKVDGDFDLRGRIASRSWSTSRWGKGGLMARQELSISSHYIFIHDNPDPDGARLATRPTHGGNDNVEPFVLGNGTHPDWYRLQRSGNTITGFHSTNGATWTAFGSRTWTGGRTAYLGLALTSHSGCGVATLAWDQIVLSGTVLPPDDPGPGPTPQPGECRQRAPVVLNEGLIRTAGPRWIELYNRGSSAVNISDYYITDDKFNLAKTKLPPGTIVPARGFLSFTDAQLGLDFALVPPATSVFAALVEPDGKRVVDAHNFRPDHDELSEARFPDGDSEFDDAADPTRDAPNAISASRDVVINEILYHPIDDDPRKEYVELYNRGALAVNLTGWAFTNGINHAFAPGTSIPAGGYLVVARDPAFIRSLHELPAGAVVGPETPEALQAFGFLRDRGERVTIQDGLGRTVDTVRYHDGGDWARWADGLGSSLELIDPNQDNRQGQAWDASDDSAKALTQTYSYIGRHGGGESELHLAMMARGITVVDDVSIMAGGITTQDDPIIDAGEVWRYIKGTQAPPAAWKDLGFDDGGWLSGPTGIGYGDGDDATTLTDMQNGYMTIFCRRTFNIADRTAIRELVLSTVIDDGFYAYLNGTQVASYNVASPAFDASAPNAGEPTLVEVDISAFKNLLRNGSNVLAVQVHNAGIGSSDLSFIPRLLDRSTTVGGGVEQVANGTFDSNTAGWIIEGTHIRSGRTTQSPIRGGGSLKILASGRGDNKVNRIETPEAGGFGLANLSTTQDLLISFKARWVVGSQSLLTSGYEHAMAKSHRLVVPEDLGTPGRRNSVTQRLISQSGGSNLGPVIADITQSPGVPEGGEAVKVRARVIDPDGIASVTLRWSLNNPSASPASVAMTHVGGGIYEGTIPGQGLNNRVVFFITAADAGGRPGRYPADITTRTHPLLLNPPAASLNDNRYLVYRHDIKNPGTTFHNYRFFMTQANEDELTSRRLLSNDLIDGSFVFGTDAIYHESHTRFSGSPFARAGWNGSFKVVMPRDNPLHERIRKFNLDNRHGNGADGRERISHYLISRHNIGSGIPVPYSEPFMLTRWQVNSRTTGTREHIWTPDQDFIEMWFPGDDEGDFWEMDDRFVINDSGGRVSQTDGRVLYPPPSPRSDGNGANKENYRWFFNLRAKNGADDYSRFIDFARVMDPGATPNALFDQQIWNICNVEELLRIWAVEHSIDDWDTWGANRGKNCYFYLPEMDGRMNLFAWDLELTYGNVNAFLIPPSPNDPFNPGQFGEVHRMLNRPKIKRMYYAILDEMVNGPDRWFHSSYLSPFMTKLAAAGLANTGVGQPGAFIDQRAAAIQGRLQSVVSPQVRLAITTNGGNNFTTSQVSVNISGTAPVEVCEIFVNGERYLPDYPGMTTWSIDNIPLRPGDNVLAFDGLDLKGSLIDSDTITITSTAAWDPPQITALNPSTALAGSDIEILGSEFHNGVRVFFGSAQSPLVTYNENGPTPGKIVARVPAGSGAVGVTVRNVDNQLSNSMNFTYMRPPPSFLRADANGDTVVDIADAVRVLLHLFAGRAIDCQDAADVNDDELLDVSDAIHLLEYLFRRGPSIPPPFPAPGVDPAGSALGCER